MGHLHAEPLHCFLPAVYFSIYSSNVLLRQCPTLSGRFFSHFMAFCSHNTSDIRGLFETFWSTTSVYVQGTHAVSGLIKMSFDCGVRESWQRCQLGKSLFSCLKMSHLTIAPNIILHIPVTHIHICKANTSGVRESILVRQWSMTSLLWRVCILSVCLCLSLIRFLFGCQSQSPLDPLRQYRLIPKWPSTTDHQPLSTTAARQAAKKENAGFPKAWSNSSIPPLWFSSCSGLHAIFKTVWAWTDLSLQQPLCDCVHTRVSVFMYVTFCPRVYWDGTPACVCLRTRVCRVSSVSKCPCSVQLVQRCVQSWGDQQVSGSVATPSQRAT